MYGRSGTLIATSGRRDELREILERAAGLVGEMAGCHLYLVAEIPEEPDQLYVFEVWENQAAHAASLEDDRVRALIAEGRGTIAGAAGSSEYANVAGFGV